MAVEGDYVVWLNDTGSELLSFAPLETRSGWARYFGASDDIRALVRFDLDPRPTDSARPIVVRQLEVAALSRGLRSSALRDLPLGRFEAAVNQPTHYAVLAGTLPGGRSAFARVPDQGPWSSDRPDVDRPPLPSLLLDIPRTPGKKPDGFYRAVAERFAALATRPSPAQDLAEANAVPVTTVHRWVREARARGFLPPALSRRDADGDEE